MKTINHCCHTALDAVSPDNNEMPCQARHNKNNFTTYEAKIQKIFCFVTIKQSLPLQMLFKEIKNFVIPNNVFLGFADEVVHFRINK